MPLGRRDIVTHRSQLRCLSPAKQPVLVIAICLISVSSAANRNRDTSLDDALVASNVGAQPLKFRERWWTNVVLIAEHDFEENAYEHKAGWRLRRHAGGDNLTYHSSDVQLENSSLAGIIIGSFMGGLLVGGLAIHSYYWQKKQHLLNPLTDMATVEYNASTGRAVVKRGPVAHDQENGHGDERQLSETLLQSSMVPGTVLDNFMSSCNEVAQSGGHFIAEPGAVNLAGSVYPLPGSRRDSVLGQASSLQDVIRSEARKKSSPHAESFLCPTDSSRSEGFFLPVDDEPLQLRSQPMQPAPTSHEHVKIVPSTTTGNASIHSKTDGQLHQVTISTKMSLPKSNTITLSLGGSCIDINGPALRVAHSEAATPCTPQELSYCSSSSTSSTDDLEQEQIRYSPPKIMPYSSTVMLRNVTTPSFERGQVHQSVTKALSGSTGMSSTHPDNLGQRLVRTSSAHHEHSASAPVLPMGTSGEQYKRLVHQRETKSFDSTVSHRLSQQECVDVGENEHGAKPMAGTRISILSDRSGIHPLDLLGILPDKN